MINIKRMSKMTKAMLELLRIGLAMAGLFLLIDSGGKAYEAYNSQFWPTTTGEITRSAVEVRSNALGERSYYSTLLYSYELTVNSGQSLISNRVGIDAFPPADNRASAEAKLTPYSKGSIVTVYYNPTRPEKSFLEPTFSYVYLLLPFLGLCLLVAAVVLWVIERRNS